MPCYCHVHTVNTLTGHNSAIVIPRVASDPPEVDYEAELAVIIGRECKDVSPTQALDFIAGYTIANDVTARRWQGKRGGGQWVRSKSFDTFLPLGPFLVPRREIDPRDGLRIRTWLNGDLVQVRIFYFFCFYSMQSIRLRFCFFNTSVVGRNDKRQ